MRNVLTAISFLNLVIGFIALTLWFGMSSSPIAWAAAFGFGIAAITRTLAAMEES